MSQVLDPVFGAALPRELVTLPCRPRRPRRRSVSITTGVTGALAVGSATAVAALRPADQIADVPLAPPVILNGVGPTHVVLPPAPPGATYVHVELACFDGTRCFTLPDDGIEGPRDPNGVWNLVERIALPLTSTIDLINPQRIPPLDPARGDPVDVDPGTHWRLSAVYDKRLNPRQAPLPDGRIAGIPALDIPDLVPAMTTDAKPGWVSYRTLLDHAHPHLTQDGVDQAPLPVYAGDGTTVIGSADVGRSAH